MPFFCKILMKFSRNFTKNCRKINKSRYFLEIARNNQNMVEIFGICEHFIFSYFFISLFQYISIISLLGMRKPQCLLVATTSCLQRRPLRPYVQERCLKFHFSEPRRSSMEWIVCPSFGRRTMYYSTFVVLQCTSYQFT